MKHQKLIEKVVEQIKDDIDRGNVEALEEMLRLAPIKILVYYLPDEGENPKKVIKSITHIGEY